MEADTSNLNRLTQVFELYGGGSGLNVDWSKTKTAYLSSEPLPPALDELGWTWEFNAGATKMLGIPMAQSVSEVDVFSELNRRLEERLAKGRYKFTSLIGRVVIANHLILSSLWYLLTLWSGNPKELEQMQAQILRFVWGGEDKQTRNRVDKATIFRSKAEGGLGLISIVSQTRALSGRIVMWALHMNRPPNLLRDLLQLYIRDLSERRWGKKDLTWAFTPCRAQTAYGSPVWHAIAASWSISKESLIQVQSASHKE
jgi:hypothetical protein